MEDTGGSPGTALKVLALACGAYPVAMVSRPCEGSGSMQTLIFLNDRDCLFGSPSASTSILPFISTGTLERQFRLGSQALELKERGPDGDLRPYSCQVALHRAVYDSYSRAVYFVEGRALMRLGPDDVVAPLAGHRELCGLADGPGSSARFQLPHSLVSDGCGSLYVADCGAVRRVTLPRPDEPPGTEATVSTFYSSIMSAGFVDVAYDATHGRLYAATISAVYRLEHGRPPVRVAGCEGSGAALASASSVSASISGSSSAAAAAVGVGQTHGLGLGSTTWASAFAAVGASSPTLFAASAPSFMTDGPSSGGAGAGGGGGPLIRRFMGISGLVADSEGGLLIADRQHVYRLEPDGGSGAVICLGKSETSWGAAGCYPSILPSGWLALCQYHDRRVLLLHPGLGLRPALAASLLSRPSWQHEGVAGLLSDLGSLLACPDGTDDVEVAVGDRVFRCHRLILAARCVYFRRLFAGGFADSGARQVVLPDADPEAFSHLLRYLYTGDLAFPAAALRSIAELADRLLLSQVVSLVHRRMLASTQPASVMADMLWAHRQGFDDLLVELKEWYLEHQAAVLAADPDSVRQLFVAAPSLMYDLHCATVKQVAQRGR